MLHSVSIFMDIFYTAFLDIFKPAIAHRDFNTRNILVKDDLTCVISDFGFGISMMGSKIIKNGQYEIAEHSSLPDVSKILKNIF